jgi:hypothetical protein
VNAVRFPALDPSTLAETREAIHAWARVIGAWASGARRRRKHWWHASLRPSLHGLTTGVVYGPVDYELEIDLANSQLRIATSRSVFRERLVGQSAAEIADHVRRILKAAGADEPEQSGESAIGDEAFDDYSAIEANKIHRAFASVAAALEDFRAGIREEKSPIQVWPHHFDLSMIWLPGTKIEGIDPADEEQADKQMNFGFVLGDDGIPEPYLYVTAYPLPEALPEVSLPEGTVWQSEGFSGAVLRYQDLVLMDDPHAYLLDLWHGLLEAGRRHLCKDS